MNRRSVRGLKELSALVPRRGLEPPRFYPLVPETSASTNSATWAGVRTARGAGPRTIRTVRRKVNYSLHRRRGWATLRARLEWKHYVKQKRPGKPPAKKTAKRPSWMPDPPPTSRPMRSDKTNPASRKSAPKRHADPQAQREAERYEHPIPSREALLKHLSDRAQLLTAESLAQE